MGVCNCSMFCCTLLYVHFSIAIILMGKRELIALLNLSSWCLVMVERLFLTVPRGCLQFVIVVFPDHTHLLFLLGRCIVLTIYDRDGYHTIARYTGKFSPHIKVKLEFTLVLLNPKVSLVLLNPFFETLDPDQLVSFRSHLIKIYTVFHTY